MPASFCRPPFDIFYKISMARRKKVDETELQALTTRTEIPGLVHTASTSNVGQSLPSSSADEIVPKPIDAESREERRRMRRKLLRESLVEPRIDASASATLQPGGANLDSTSEDSRPHEALAQTAQEVQIDQPPETSGRLLRRKRGTTRATRFDRQEDNPNHSHPSPAKQQLSSSSPSKPLNETREDFLFFSSSLAPEVDLVASNGSKKATEQQHDEAKDDDIEASAPPEPAAPRLKLDEQLNFVDLLGQVIEGGEYWNHVSSLVTEPTTVDYIPYRQRKANERKRLHTISRDVQRILSSSVESSSAEMDGLYVGTIIAPPHTSKDRFDTRVLEAPSSSRQVWLAENGQVVRLPYPLKPHSMRPETLLEAENHSSANKRKVMFHVAEPAFDLTSLSTSSIASNPYLLEIDIVSVSFASHPLFLPEHEFASKLSNLYQQYHIRSKLQPAQHLTNRLLALKNAEARLRKVMEASDGSNNDLAMRQQKRLWEYHKEIRQVRRLRDEEDRVRAG
jgi:hypothetical protein